MDQIVNHDLPRSVYESKQQVRFECCERVMQERYRFRLSRLWKNRQRRAGRPASRSKCHTTVHSACAAVTVDAATGTVEVHSPRGLPPCLSQLFDSLLRQVEELSDDIRVWVTKI